MRTEFLALALFTASALYGQSSCPTQAPFGLWIISPGCPSPGCIAGSPLHLTTYELPPPAPPPQPCPGMPCEPTYSLQPCDKVTWHFGDGTPDVTVTGQATITHTYAAAGVYSPHVTISNTLGSIQGPPSPITVASNPPTYVDFSPAAYTVPENAGSITFTLVRSGNLTTTATVHYQHDLYFNSSLEQAEAISGDLTFAPGETMKSFTMKIFDDHVYTAPFTDSVSLSAADGTLIRSSSAQFILTEVTPQPTATVSDVRVAEGTATPNTADIVVTMSAPISGTVEFLGVPADGTASAGSDYSVYNDVCDIPGGAVQCVIHFPIVNDDVPEPDEIFTVKVHTLGWVGPRFVRDTATVTIVNDDAAIMPRSQQIATGARLTLTLDIGQPPPSPLTVPLQSSSPEVLEVPPSVTIAAGESTAGFTAHALQAGRSRVTATVPAMNVSASLITVIDAVSVVADPAAAAARPGSDTTVSLSFQPPRATAQTVSLWSTRPDVAAVADALTIPAGGKATLTIHGLANGTATIWIVTADGLSFSVEVTVADGATVASIDPPNAPANGGSSVMLLGQGLDARCSVVFGAVSAPAVTPFVGGLVVAVPPHAPGVVDVTVACGSTRIVLPNAFTFFNPRRRAAG